MVRSAGDATHMHLSSSRQPNKSALGWVRLHWDRCAAWVLIAAGVVALVLGWLGVSSTPYPAQQISYAVSGGLSGVCLFIVGGMLWLSADLRDQWFKLDRLETKMRTGIDESLEADGHTQEEAGRRVHSNGAVSQ